MKVYPEKYEAGDFAFFLHIPKTAGTSVASALNASFPEDQVLSHFQVNNVRTHPTEIFEKAAFFHGHFTYDVHTKRLPKKPNFILTFLRDPVQHYISTFFHLKVDPTFAYTIRLTTDKELSQEIHQSIQDMTIEDFLQYEHSRLFDNFQTRYLIKGLIHKRYRRLSDEQKLPIAQRLILDLPFFGLTERMDESFSMLGHVMGLEKKLRLRKSNKSRNKPRGFTLSPSATEEIQSRTRVDQSLYSLGQEAFEARLVAFQASTAG